MGLHSAAVDHHTIGTPQILHGALTTRRIEDHSGMTTRDRGYADMDRAVGIPPNHHLGHHRVNPDSALLIGAIAIS